MTNKTFDRSSINSKNAPSPVGSYVHAVKIAAPDSMLFVSGQIPLDASTGKIIEGGTADQAKLVLTHVKNIVEDAGFSMTDIVKCNIYMTDLADFGIVNEVYSKFFPGPDYPARAAVEVSRLPKDVKVEIEAIAIKG